MFENCDVICGHHVGEPVTDAIARFCGSLMALVRLAGYSLTHRRALPESRKCAQSRRSICRFQAERPRCPSSACQVDAVGKVRERHSVSLADRKWPNKRAGWRSARIPSARDARLAVYSLLTNVMKQGADEAAMAMAA